MTLSAAVVVDASVAIKWIIPEEGTDKALALQKQWKAKGLYPCAPDFLLIELHNVLWKKLVRGLIHSTDPVVGQTPSFGLDMNWVSSQSLLTSAFLLALQHRITIYDSLYVALAQSLSAPLYTADRTLANQLKTLSVPVEVI